VRKGSETEAILRKRQLDRRQSTSQTSVSEKLMSPVVGIEFGQAATCLVLAAASSVRQRCLAYTGTKSTVSQ